MFFLASCASQVPGLTPMVVTVGLQTVLVQLLLELAVTALQLPGSTAATALSLRLQVVTTKLAPVPEVQVCTGVGVVGPLFAQVVRIHWLAELGATGVQLFSATGVGPVVESAGQLMVTQLLLAFAVCALQLPGCTPTVLL